MITAKLREKHCIVIFSCVNYTGCELYLNSAENEYVYRKFPNFVHCVKSQNITWKYYILISLQYKNHSTLYRRKCKHCLMPHQEVLHALSFYSPVTEIILDSLILSQTHRDMEVGSCRMTRKTEETHKGILIFRCGIRLVANYWNQ